MTLLGYFLVYLVKKLLKANILYPLFVSYFCIEDIPYLMWSNHYW